jgi:hypothetical protein
MDERIPPERPLDDAARARRRAELLAAVEAGGAASPTRAWRWLAPAGVAAAVAAGVVAGAVLLGGGDEQAQEPGPAGGGTRAAAPSATSVPPSASTSPSDGSRSCGPETVPQAQRKLRRELLGYRKLLPEVQAYRDIVARHLDPAGEHLDARATGVQSGTDECNELSALGTRLGWSVAGQDGLGEVQVEVSTDWADAQVHLAHDGWRDAEPGVPGVVRAWSVKYDGGFAVAVTRKDGLTVALDANELFGNNSLTGISGFPFSPDDLFRTAADPAFALP